VYNDIFNHLDGVMRALVKKKTQLKEVLFFSVKLARQKLSKYYPEVIRTMSMLRISAHILDPFRQLRSFRKWDKGFDITPEDKTSCTTQYKEAFLKYMGNEYCAKLRRVPVNKLESLQCSTYIPCTTAPGFCQPSVDLYDLSSDVEEYITSTNVAETTPACSDRAAQLLTAVRLYLNSLPEAPKNWGQINPNLNNYHYNPMAIRGIFYIPDITDW
jgi:hypothetical protein